MPLPESTSLRLKTQLHCLPTLLSGTTEEALEFKPQPGQWCAREHLAHLALYQRMFLRRLQRLQSEHQPLLPRYRAEEDPEWTEWAQRAAPEIFEDLQSQRRELIRQAEGLSDDELARTGIHTRFGTLTVLQWLEFFLLHEAHHLLSVLQRTRE
jgi:uncharacterized damage-inducible protein DinB